MLPKVKSNVSKLDFNKNISNLNIILKLSKININTYKYSLYITL